MRRGESVISYQRLGEAAVATTVDDTSAERMPLSLRYHRRPYIAAKRAFDIVFGSLALIVLFPIFLVVSLAIVLTDGFPIVFRQKRVGKDGKEFYIYKFRTMVKNAEEILRSRPDLMEEYQKTYKITNDPRISQIGRLLRKTSLDELPQLLNVVYGEMSLVGPRPIVPKELEKYGDMAWAYLLMKPGCAGLWQCSGRSDISYDERVHLDLTYYQKAGLRYDSWVILRTIFEIIRCRGAN
jgi:exopolysaccharide production protein ExoY